MLSSILYLPVLICAGTAQVPDLSCLSFFNRKVPSTTLKATRCIVAKSPTDFAKCYNANVCPNTTLDQWVAASYEVAQYFNSLSPSQLKSVVNGGTSVATCATDILALNLPAGYTPNGICTAGAVLGPFTGPTNLVTVVNKPTFPWYPSGITNANYFSTLTTAANKIYTARGGII